MRTEVEKSAPDSSLPCCPDDVGSWPAGCVAAIGDWENKVAIGDDDGQTAMPGRDHSLLWILNTCQRSTARSMMPAANLDANEAARLADQQDDDCSRTFTIGGWIGAGRRCRW
ncbi:hypothetical protein ACLOJK_022666 [Asimina triloba]